MNKLIFLLMFAFFLPTAQGQTVAPKKLHRYALVIGNKTYTGDTWKPLKSPIKDAQDLSVVLKDAGFQIMTNNPILNATGKGLREAIDDFGSKVREKRRDIIKREAADKEAIIAVVFYSGHGFTANGTSFLVGTDAKGKNAEEFSLQSAKLSPLLADLSPDDYDVEILSLFLLDACRTSVTIPSLAGASGKGNSSAESGIFQNMSGSGRIIVFATVDGKVSFDGRNENENSVFTEALLEAAKKPSQPINFTDYIARIKTNTPIISFGRFNARQTVEVSDTTFSDFFWTDQLGKQVAVNVTALNEKGSTPGGEAWIYLGDKPAADADWTTAKFKFGDGKSPPNSVSVGAQIQLQANLNARASLPTPSTRCGPKKYQECSQYLGTLPLGLKVNVVESPQTNNPQKWVKVRFDEKALYQIQGLQNP